LGNNLFQIANVISVAKNANTNFIFPNTSWAGHRGHVNADLSIFGYDFSRGDVECENEYHEINFHYDEVPIKSSLKLNGFFQSWKYFENIKDDLLSTYFIPNKSISERLKKISISENSLAISVRRGDYLMLQNNHCVIGLDYYQKCIDKYFTTVDQIFVFSDDFDWCKTIFGNDAIYVEEDRGTQLFLMANVKNMILSNSTFAWWGAYLNQQNGIIVAPSPWFGSNYKDKNTSDLYVPTWKIETHVIEFQSYNITDNMYN
jgi:hypothetical protein